MTRFRPQPIRRPRQRFHLWALARFVRARSAWRTDTLPQEQPSSWTMPSQAWHSHMRWAPSPVPPTQPGRNAPRTVQGCPLGHWSGWVSTHTHRSFFESMFDTLPRKARS